MIQILPLGAGQDVGRSCIIVTLGGKTVMFDCGMHMGFNDERRFPDFTAISAGGQFDRVVDLVIISHFHLDHCGGLPYFTEMCGYNGPILMTSPTKDIAPILLEDFRKITVERRGEQNFFTSAMIRSCMNKVIPIELGSEVQVAEDIFVRAYYAGHVLGAAMFYVRVGNESVLYTGDYNMTPDRHLGAAIVDRCEPDVLITESTYAATIRDSKRARERDFLKQVHKCVAEGGKVLVPTFALGRVQELCILIDAYWTRAGLGDIPVYFTGGMAEAATKYYGHWMSWTNEAVLAASLKPGRGPVTNPFNFQNIRTFERSFADHPGPMVVFSTPGMLHSGTSLELFKKWCSDSKNMLIVPGYCVAGTVGAKVLAGQRQIEVQEMRVRGTSLQTQTVTLDVNLQVKNLSFSAHVDAKGILQLISQCRPKNVVLVHGEGSKMKVLKNKITETFQCPVFHPSNGQVLFIQSQPSDYIAISPELLANRMNCIKEAADAVNFCSQFDMPEKLKLLAESAKIQGRPEAIAWNGYWFWDGTVEVPPVLLDAETFAKRAGEERQFERLFELKFTATRFITTRLLVKYAKLDDYLLYALHAFLIEQFHPQIAVVYEYLDEECTLVLHASKLKQPLVKIVNFLEIPAAVGRITYTMQWCEAGEKLAKACLRAFRDHLE